MPIPISIVVSVGLIGTMTALIMRMSAGRSAPLRRVPWVIALIALGVDGAIHVAISVGSLVTGGWEASWVAVGSLAIVGVFALAWIAPRIAGWWLVATAVGLPLLLVVTSALWPSTDEPVPVGVMLAFYTPRMLVVGGLLIWSSIERSASPTPSSSSERRHDAHPVA